MSATLNKEKCLEYIRKLGEADTLSMFAKPVNPKEVPGYLDVVDTPMDLSTIREKLLGGKYNCDNEVEVDVTLMISNALAYNHKESEYYTVAKNLRRVYHRLAVSCGLEVDEDTAYIPSKRFRDDETTLRTAETKSLEDMKDVVEGLDKDQAIPLEELRKMYQRRPQQVPDEELEKNDEEESSEYDSSEYESSEYESSEEDCSSSEEDSDSNA